MEEYRSNMNILKEVLRGKRPHDDVEFVAWLKESEEHQKCYEEVLQQAASDLRIKKSFNRQKNEYEFCDVLSCVMPLCYYRSWLCLLGGY